MEDKKVVKVSAGTVVCIFIIILLVIALGVMYYFGFVNNKKSGEVTIKTADTVNPQNSNTKEIKTDNYAELGTELFSKFLQNQKDIVEFKINSCELVCFYNDEFICGVSYDVKPTGNVENSPWIAGNGEVEGNWIKGKSVFLSFKKVNGEYKYNEEVGQMTAWDIDYFVDDNAKSDISNNSSNSNNSYSIGTIKNIYDVISDNDTKLVQAQKIAKEVMNAVNNKDWYYLAKMVGVDADAFIKYGIHNYNINVNDYQEINGEYVFNETYETTSPVDASLGKMLIIKFEDGGRIVIDPNCTGI